MRSSKTSSFGFGGPDGLKKEAKKADEDDEWGLGDDTKTGGGFGGRLLGRKPKKDDGDDDLDDVLDVLEAKRGLGSSKGPEPEAPKPRPKTAAPKNTAGWGAADPDDLEDVDDGASQASGRGSQRGGVTDQALAAKRRALFGGGAPQQMDA